MREFLATLKTCDDLLLLFFLWSGCCLFDTFPISILIFSSPFLKGNVSFCHYLASVVVVRRRPLSVVRRRRKLFQRSSSLKLLNQFQPILRVSRIKFVFYFPFLQKTWPLWLKIEHRGKMQFLAYISKTKAFRANLTWGKIVHQVKIYQP